MRHRTWIALLVLAGLGLAVGLPGAVVAQEPPERWSEPPPAEGEVIPEHRYMGVEDCARCHRMDRKGNQLGQWRESAHSGAYETLASDEARAIAEERGLGNPQEEPECLRCHTTAFGVPDEYLMENFDRTQGVQCEACHGPGEDYSGLRVMRDREQSYANGLVIPDERVCLRCHNEQSPTYQGFDFEERYEQIAHDDPTTED